MKKHILVALLWFYTGWYLGAFVVEATGISAVFAPLIGAGLAVLATVVRAERPTSIVRAD
jgi:hypothetical protein